MKEKQDIHLKKIGAGRKIIKKIKAKDIYFSQLKKDKNMIKSYLGLILDEDSQVYMHLSIKKLEV